MREHLPLTHTPMITGEIQRAPSSAPFRVLATVSGLLLVKAILLIIFRYLLAFRRKGTASVEGNLITVTEEWSLFGRSIRRRVTTHPIDKVAAIRFENRQRYLYLVVGFGCLAVGTLVGAQWLLDGLRAGYPYLTLVGALIVLAGVAADVLLYLLCPFKGGRSYLIVASGPWITRFCGVETAAAERFIESVHTVWSSSHAAPRSRPPAAPSPPIPRPSQPSPPSPSAPPWVQR